MVGNLSLFRSIIISLQSASNAKDVSRTLGINRHARCSRRWSCVSPPGPRCWDAALVCISTNSVSLNSWTKFPRHPWKVSRELTKECSSLHIAMKDVTVRGQFICGSHCILQVLLGSAKHLSVEYNSQIKNNHVSLRNRLSEDLTTARSIIWSWCPFMLGFTQANLAKPKRWQISNWRKYTFFFFPLSTS